MHFPVGLPDFFDQVCEVIIIGFRMIIWQQIALLLITG